MKAAYNAPVLYRITAKMASPLRTGGTDGDTEAVLRDAAGRPFVQGTSIAGAVREWLDIHEPKYTNRLMGGHRGSGRLVFSDGVFGPEAEQYIRPRLRIDPVTGTAADGAKFDLAHIGSGANLYFTITWLGDTPQQKDEMAVVEQVLAAMDAGEICLGGQKTNGFGRLQLQVCRRAFDLTKEEDRSAWLKAWQDESKPLGDKITLPKLQNPSYVRFKLKGVADSLLVRAAAVEQKEGKGKDKDKDGKGSYTPNITEGGYPVLPGSSVKGSIRGRATAIAALVGLDSQKLDEIFGRDAKDGDDGIAGKVSFADLQLRPLREAPVITRIRINKFTGGVIHQGLFQEQPVCAPVTLGITAPDDSITCALLLYALRDLGYGLYNLGSNGSIGRGLIRTESIDMEAPDGRKASIKMDGGNAVLQDPNGLVAEWLKAWGGIHHEA